MNLTREHMGILRAHGISNFSGMDFNNCNLSGLYLGYADFSNAVFSNANLSKTNFTHANLLEADFSYANLKAADFGQAHLRYANFHASRLFLTWFVHADSRDADLRQSYIGSTIFAGARIENIKVNWYSHDLISKILTDAWITKKFEYRAAAALVAQLPGLCWEGFEKILPKKIWRDGLKVLAKYVVDKTEAPEVLRPFLKDY